MTTSRRARSVLEANRRKRWWAVAWLLGATAADIAALSNVKRQTVHAEVQKRLDGRIFYRRPTITRRQLYDYRALFDKLEPQHWAMDYEDVAQLIIAYDQGAVQTELKLV